MWFGKKKRDDYKDKYFYTKWARGYRCKNCLHISSDRNNGICGECGNTRLKTVIFRSFRKIMWTDFMWTRPIDVKKEVKQ